METPIISHITAKDYQYIYEPAEDSFLLIDALEKDLKFIQKVSPAMCLEVGSGSGIVIAALAKVLSSKAICLATDINLKACHMTKQTGVQNGVCVETLHSNLVDCLRGKFDIIVFNPPYVVTLPEEVGSGILESTWAGGKKGREVMDKLFPRIPELLSHSGAFYLLIINENCANEIHDIFENLGMTTEVILSRRAGREHLSVLKITWKIK